MAITTSSLLYLDSLAPPTSAWGVSNPMTTKVPTPATTTQTTAVPISRLDVQITPRPNAEVYRQRRPAIHVDGHSMGQRVSPITCLKHRLGRPRITSNWASVRVVGSAKKWKRLFSSVNHFSVVNASDAEEYSGRSNIILAALFWSTCKLDIKVTLCLSPQTKSAYSNKGITRLL